MRKPYIRHENLRRIIAEIEDLKENAPDETLKMLLLELKHSDLIAAGNVEGEVINIQTVKTDKGDFALLFTDMDEFRKTFPGFEEGAIENAFHLYKEMFAESDLLGFVINIDSECFIFPKKFLDYVGDMPQTVIPDDDAYTSLKLKDIRDSIDNEELERFVEDPKNLGRYEELFERISSSVMLTLMVSREDLEGKAEDGIISTIESEPLGFLYVDDSHGHYATAYTSEAKIGSVRTPLYKYSQIVNFSLLANFALNDDMDGIIINPNSDNVVLTRDVLLEFSPILEKTCYDSKLNNAIFHMFLIEEEA